MTKKDFILQAVISMAANPEFTFESGDEEDDDEYTCLKHWEIYVNAEGLANHLEEEGIVFDEEGN